MGAKLCPQCGTRYEGDNRFCTLDGATLVAENPADSLQGTVLADRYLIDRKLGEGGMGEVYLAEHIRMKRKVAVKVMRAWLTKDPAAIGRFHREAENASQITHPNVAGVYDFGETDQGLVYLAMEFVEGESLTTVLDREKTLNHIRASDIVSQISDALAAAHSLGILHRDLKPDNVMIGRTRARTDLVKLLDFGIARVMGRETQHFTSTGLIVGTPEWMSPEQIAGDNLDARSDIYTLGLIAFRMLTGQGAFSGTTSQEVLLAKMTKAPRHLHDVVADVEWPEELEAAMDKVLATDPNLRYDDALLFAADFYGGVSRLPMTQAAEEYYALLIQRSVTPGRLSTIESTPVRGMPTIQTPSTPMPRREANVPQLADTTVLPSSLAAGLKAAAEAAEPAATTGKNVGIHTPVELNPAFPYTTAELPTSEKTVEDPAPETKRRGPLYAIAGIAAVAVVALAVSQLGGNVAPTPAATADSAAIVAVSPADSANPAAGGPDSALPVAVRAGGPAAGTESVTAGRSVGPVLDSVANRTRGSVFTIVRGRNRSTAFLAATDGMLLTSSSGVGSSPLVDVFLDGSRRVRGLVVSVDSARGLAAVLIATRTCPSACAPLSLAADRVQYRNGDSVIAVTGATLVSPGRRSKGALTNATAQRLTAALGTGESGTGSPVLLSDGNVLGLVRNGGGASAMLIPASVARAFLREAQAARTSKNLQPVDSILQSWPARPLGADDLAAGLRRTSKDLDAFRVRGRDFEALIMTPQILALRKAEADTLRKYFNPGSTTTMFCDGNGPCDPIEAWGGLSDYLGERRAVVTIQVAPSRFPPPYRGEHARQDMNRRPVINQILLTRANAPLEPIEAHRIFSVVNPGEYPDNQKEALYSILAVYNPNLILEAGGLELQIATVGGRDRQRIPIPQSVLDAIRRDLASVVR